MLEFRGVTGGYGETTVLHEVTLSVPDASVVALLGPNGAGKSTTLRMASGLLKPDSGTIAFDGDDISEVSAHQRSRRGICHVPEGRGIFPSLTVRENVALFAEKRHGAESWERAVETFPVLGDRRRQTAGTLSGGEQQMLSLARAYVANPRLVLVDEASLGLAPFVVDQIFEFLERLALSGASLLLVEQYVSRALALAETIFVLNQGRIVHSGSATDLDTEKIFALYAGDTVESI